MSEDKTREYYELLKEFTTYREESVAQKEQMKKEIEKCKQQLQKFIGKIDKRIDSRMNEERNLNNYHLEQLEDSYKQQVQQLKKALTHRDNLIEELRKILRQVEQEKREIIQNNTKVLIELSEDLEPNNKKGAKDQSYKELLKMYQFLMEENNELKKQIYVLKRNNLASSHYQEDKSINVSQFQKTPNIQSNKKELDKSLNTKLDRSLNIKQSKKDKVKKIPKPKQGK